MAKPKHKTGDARKVELAARANRAIKLDAINRRATVVPSGKVYKRVPKHRGQNW